jgi:bifunctional DNase/RNase
MDAIQVDIVGLSTSPSSGGAYALVLGEIEGDRRLPIIIGAFEAQAIALELEKIQPPRPMTHDLLRDLYESLEAEVVDVVIDDLRDGTFFAKINYRHESDEKQLDSRPSDAVALAVRVDAPIYVAPGVLDEAGIHTEEEELSELAAPGGGSPSTGSGGMEEEGMSKIEKMEVQLQKAIDEENYERAAELRDELQRLKGDGDSGNQNN